MAVKPEETPHGAFALAFAKAVAKAVAKGRYDLAYSMLLETLQASTSAKQLAEDYDTMVGPYECPPDNFPEFDVMNVFNEQASRLEISTGRAYVSTGGAYVAMSNNYYCEAVSVVIAEEQGKKVICEIFWGRP